MKECLFVLVACVAKDESQRYILCMWRAVCVMCYVFVTVGGSGIISQIQSAGYKGSHCVCSGGVHSPTASVAHCYRWRHSGCTQRCTQSRHYVSFSPILFTFSP